MQILRMRYLQAVPKITATKRGRRKPLPGPVDVLSASLTCAGSGTPAGVLGVHVHAGAVRRVDLGFTDGAAGDLLWHQADRRMPAPTGPEEPAVGGEDRTVVFQGEREINAIP